MRLIQDGVKEFTLEVVHVHSFLYQNAYYYKADDICHGREVVHDCFSIQNNKTFFWLANHTWFCMCPYSVHNEGHKISRVRGII
jgi:hypothetical protein